MSKGLNIFKQSIKQIGNSFNKGLINSESLTLECFKRAESNGLNSFICLNNKDDLLKLSKESDERISLKKRKSEIKINLPKEYFQVTSTKEGMTLKQTLDKGECELMLNGSSTISEEDKKKHRLTCERANMYKNYYTHLYGLPMKLKDPGTIIDSTTEKKTFKGKEYLVLKATYEKEVGEDIWYFYFDPKTYAMEVYQFFHDVSKNDGEYILLTGEEEVSGIKMPKTRAWYYNKDDKYLGTDVLTKTSSL